MLRARKLSGLPIEAQQNEPPQDDLPGGSSKAGIGAPRLLGATNILLPNKQKHWHRPEMWWVLEEEQTMEGKTRLVENPINAVRPEMERKAPNSEFGEYLSPREACRLLGIGKSTFYAKQNPKYRQYDPSFPQPYQVADRSPRWSKDDLIDWVNSRRENSVPDRGEENHD